MPSEGPRFWTTLNRGLHKRCPHCGRGPIFSGWFTRHERCPVCGLVYERNSGDTWGFWIVGDRIPIAAGIILIYFGFQPKGWIAIAASFLVLVVPLVWTMPHRMGVAIALAYLSRVWWPEPLDPLPPLPPDRDPPTD